MAPVYVNMTDTFLGDKLAIVCDTMEQAEAIVKAAQDRREMRYVTLCLGRPKGKGGKRQTFRPFAELSGPWLDYYRPAGWKPPA